MIALLNVFWTPIMILNKEIVNETEGANWIIGKTVQRGHLGLVLYGMMKNLRFTLPQFYFLR